MATPTARKGRKDEAVASDQSNIGAPCLCKMQQLPTAGSTLKEAVVFEEAITGSYYSCQLSPGLNLPLRGKVAERAVAVAEPGIPG